MRTGAGLATAGLLGASAGMFAAPSAVAVGVHTPVASTVHAPGSKAIANVTLQAQSGPATSGIAAVTPVAKGALSVRISGLPATGVPWVVVTGPKQSPRATSGYRVVVRKNTTLAGLVPGTYKVAALEVRVNGQTFQPARAAAVVQVVARRTTASVVTYVPDLAFTINEAHVDSWSRVAFVFSANRDNAKLPTMATLTRAGELTHTEVTLRCTRLTARKASCTGVGAHVRVGPNVFGVSSHPAGAAVVLTVEPSYTEPSWLGRRVVTVDAGLRPSVSSLSWTVVDFQPLRFSVDTATVPTDIGAWNATQGMHGSPVWPEPQTVSVFRGNTRLFTYDLYDWAGGFLAERPLTCSRDGARMDCALTGLPSGTTITAGETLKVRIGWSAAADTLAGPDVSPWAALTESVVVTRPEMTMSGASISSTGHVEFTLTSTLTNQRGNPPWVTASRADTGVIGLAPSGNMTCTPWSPERQKTCTGQMQGVSNWQPAPFNQQIGTQLTLSSAYGTPNSPEALVSQTVQVTGDAG